MTIAANGCSYAVGRERITRSTAGSMGSNWTLTISRTRRFSLLRSTAEWPCRGTITPTRGCPRGEARYRMSKCRLRIRFPPRMTASSSLFRVSRSCREKRTRSSGAGVLARQPHRQNLAALLATTAENFTSPLGGHARAKSVGTDAALVAGTICRLTHLETPISNAWQRRAKRAWKGNRMRCKVVGSGEWGVGSGEWGVRGHRSDLFSRRSPALPTSHSPLLTRTRLIAFSYPRL